LRERQKRYTALRSAISGREHAWYRKFIAQVAENSLPVCSVGCVPHIELLNDNKYCVLSKRKKWKFRLPRKRGGDSHKRSWRGIPGSNLTKIGQKCENLRKLEISRRIRGADYLCCWSWLYKFKNLL